MKFATPTHRKEFLRCPKRYEFRYLYSSDDPAQRLEHQRRSRLYGLRELAGHLVHRTVAGFVREFAETSRYGNTQAMGEKCRDRFLEIVAHSCATDPGVLLDGPQLAETFNGRLDDSFGDEVRFYRDTIPVMIENAARALFTLNLPLGGGSTVLTEHPVSFRSGLKNYRFIFDLLVQTSQRAIVVDWKTYAIDDECIRQVRRYLQFLHQREGIPVSRLYGFAVNLLREEIVPVTYNPYRTNQSFGMSSKATVEPGDPFPARPHPQLCARCPYTDLCAESAVKRH